MHPETSITIVLCTRNRARSLARTLATIGKLAIPNGWKVEVLVVDNASTDETEAVTRSVRLPNMEVRYWHEAREGKSYALNSGVAQARGEFLLFLDDDVLPAENWLEQLATPLIDNKSDAVTGQLVIAPHLLRPWLTQMHKMWLALSLDAESRDWSQELIGANMGFRRSVLAQVPGYDLELGPGPGAVGFCEDTFLGRQLRTAGYRLAYVPQAVAIHDLDESRLRRAAWLSDAGKRGRTEAYVRYHWEHSDVQAPLLKLLWYWSKLHLRRVLQPPPSLESEGCPTWEMSYVFHQEMCRQFRRERRRPRNYLLRGLTKLPQVADPSSS